jgi:hypothetical protein
VASLCGLDEFDEHATGVLRVHEVDPAVRRPSLGDVVEQPQAALAQGGTDRLDVVHPEGQLLQAGTGAADELGDRRLGGERREKLDTPCSSLVSSCTECTPKAWA